MDLNEQESLIFQSCRSLDGSIHSVNLGRRNGKLTPLFHPAWTSWLGQPKEVCKNRFVNIRREISRNLTPVERRTWKKLIDGKSILEIAKEEGVSRTAIYERIRGNSKAQGGMIAKNDYVAAWWYLRTRKAA